MRTSAILFWLLLFWGTAAFAADDPQKNVPMPSSLVIGRHTFLDFGPPSDYYEVIVLQAVETGTLISRVIATPAADACIRPATIEVAAAQIPQSLDVLLEQRNPCVISQKALQQERKRRKQGLVFSGAEVSIALKCGAQERIVRANVLDRDLFDPSVSTPENTSWTMRILETVDKALGGGVLDKPAFPDGVEETQAASAPAPQVVRQLAAGGYDDLFRGAPDKPSELYRASQVKPPVSQVLLMQGDPIRPNKFVAPRYPPLARLAHIEGSVVFSFKPGADGHPRDIVFESGNPILQGSVQKAAPEWVFPLSAVGKETKATVEFKLNCAVPLRSGVN